MTEADIIKKSHETLVEDMFKIYWQALLSKPSSGQLQQAEMNFKNGIVLARRARDSAIALLPP